MRDVITRMETAVLKYKGDHVIFRDKISIPMAPATRSWG